MKYLFDSNILIYHLRGSLNQRGSDLILEGLTGEGAYSIISKIELLGFNQTPAEEQQARIFLAGLSSGLRFISEANANAGFYQSAGG